MSQSSYIPITPSSATAVGGGASISFNGYSIEWSGATSISLNGLFINTYQSYFYIMTNLGTTNPNIRVRMRNSGSDTSANYFYQRLVAQAASNTRETSMTEWLLGYSGTSGNGSMTFIGAPKEGINTGVLTEGGDGTSTSRYHRVTGRLANATGSYDGMTLFVVGGGTFSGRMCLYGVIE